jgi:hypothetical protein
MLYHAMTEEAGLLSQHVVISLVYLVKNLYLDQVHKLQPLSQDKADPHKAQESVKENLFCRKAFLSVTKQQFQRCCPKELVKLSMDIVIKCEGLPLAIVAIGGLLSTKEKVPLEWKKLHAIAHFVCCLQAHSLTRKGKEHLLTAGLCILHEKKQQLLTPLPLAATSSTSRLPQNKGDLLLQYNPVNQFNSFQRQHLVISLPSDQKKKKKKTEHDKHMAHRHHNLQYQQSGHNNKGTNNSLLTLLTTQTQRLLLY